MRSLVLRAEQSHRGLLVDGSTPEVLVAEQVKKADEIHPLFQLMAGEAMAQQIQRQFPPHAVIATQKTA